MSECELCGESGDISLMKVNHKEKGKIMVCRDCWQKIYSENDFYNSGSSSSSSNSRTGGCAACGI